MEVYNLRAFTGQIYKVNWGYKMTKKLIVQFKMKKSILRKH